MRLLIIEMVLGALLVVMALALLFERRLPRYLIAPSARKKPQTSSPSQSDGGHICAASQAMRSPTGSV